MTVFQKVTLASLKKNKTRTVVTIIGIMLSAAMICAVTTFAGSIRHYGWEYAVYQSGNWHGCEWNTSYETYEAVRDHEEVETAYYLQQRGYAVAQGGQNEFKPYIYLLGMMDGAQEYLPIHLTAGRFPTTPKEILLPAHLYTDGGVAHAIGDTLTLPLGQRMLEGDALNQQSPCYVYADNDEVPNGETLQVEQTAVFTVVGFYERLGYDMEAYSAPGYTAFTMADLSQKAYGYDVYFMMRSPKTVYDFMEEQGLYGDTNSDVLMFTGVSQYDSFSGVLYGLSAIVIVLIMCGSVSLIYNAFSISVSERTKQFGLLSSVGATGKQLHRMVLFEALAVSTVGIPLGILAGIGGIGVTLLFIGDKFRSLGLPFGMTLYVSWLSVAVAVIVALVTVLLSAWVPSRRATKVTAVEAIRQQADIHVSGKRLRSPRWIYRLFGLSGTLADKSYKRHRKKYRTTVISLFMSIVLFVSASAFSDYLTETVEGGVVTHEYDLLYDASAVDMDHMTAEEWNTFFKEQTAVTDSAYHQKRFYQAQTSSLSLTDRYRESMDFERLGDENGNTATVSLSVYFVDDAHFERLLSENRLEKAAYTDPQAPRAIIMDRGMDLDEEAQRYVQIDILKTDTAHLTVNMPKEIEGYTFVSETYDNNGNVCYLYESDSDGETRLIPIEEASAPQVFYGAGVVEEKPFYIGDIGLVLVYPQSMKTAVMGEESFTDDDYSFYITSSDHAQSETAIKSSMAGKGIGDSKKLYNYAEGEEENRNIVLIIRVFSYGFVVLISLIAAANVFNTVSTNIRLRRREFAMLRSVGMTRKGLNEMMCFECLLYGTRALLWGLPAAAGVTYLIWRVVSDGIETTFRLPLTAIGVSVISVFAVVFASMMYALKAIKKEDPIIALKSENT